jgi:hypothetical protein
VVQCYHRERLDARHTVDGVDEGADHGVLLYALAGLLLLGRIFCKCVAAASSVAKTIWLWAKEGKWRSGLLLR